MNTDPEAIAREILRLKAAGEEASKLPEGAAYLDLRAQLDESEARRVTARQERDAAVRALRRCVITRFRGLAAVPLRAQLDAVTAQRDELREAAQSYSDMHGMCDGMEPCKSYMSGHRDACETEARLLKALEAAR